MFVFLSFYVALVGVENERKNIGAFPALAVTGKTWSRAKNVQGCRGRGRTGRNGDTRAGQAHPRGERHGAGARNGSGERV